MDGCEVSKKTSYVNFQESYVFPSSRIAVVGELIISLFGIILNTLLLNAHVRDPLKILNASSSSSFIVNIAVIDFLASCCFFAHSLMVIILFDSQHVASKAMKILLWYVQGLFPMVSLASFLGLAIERFASVAFPLWHRVKITHRVCRIWLFTSWGKFLCFDGLTLGLFYAFTDSHYAMSVVFSRNGIELSLYLLTNLVYLGTFISLKKQRMELAKTQDPSAPNLRAIQIRLKNEKNFLVTIAILCSILAILILPISVLPLVRLIRMELSGQRQFCQRISGIGLTAMALNFAVNPLIYLWRWPKYRKTCKQLYYIFS